MKNNISFCLRMIFTSLPLLLIFSNMILFQSCLKNSGTASERHFSSSNASSKNSLPEQTSDTKKIIGFSIDTLIVERWIRDCDVFIAAAREYGADVIVQNANNSVEMQKKQLQFLIDKGVDALVIVAKTADSLVDEVQKARAKNIPVISYDRLMLNSDVSLYLSIDSRQTGFLLAQYTFKKKSHGNFWCIFGSEKDHNMLLFDDGVKTALEGKPVLVPVKFFADEWNYDLAYKKMNSLLETGISPDAVICGNDAIAEMVIRSLAEHKKSAGIPVVAQDAEIAACRRIVEGTQLATVYKPITELAKLAAKCACQLANGVSPEELEEVSGVINNGLKDVPVCWLEPTLVTCENLKEAVINSGFHSEDEVFGSAF